MKFRKKSESNGVVNLAYIRRTSDVISYPTAAQDDTRDGEGAPKPVHNDIEAELGVPQETPAPDPKEERPEGQHGDKVLVPDGGWGWMVAFGAALIMMLINIVGPCFSIIFSGFLLNIGTSSTTVGWIFNIFQFIYNFSGPLLGPLLVEFSWRSVAIPCTILVSCSLILSAFAESAEFLLFSYSLLGGISCGLMNNLCYMIVPNYFEKRRGIANAILVAGVSCGPLVGPLLVSYLLENFGFKGATILTGAVVLNATVGAAVFRPLQKRSKKDAVASAGSENAKKSLGSLLLRVIWSTVTNTYVLKSPRAVIIALSGTLTLNSWLNFMTIVPFAVQASGFTFQDAAFCITISAVCNLVASLAISTLSDCSFFNMRVSCMLSTGTIGAATLAFSFLEDITWLTVAMGVWGVGVGAYMGTYNLVIVRYMGIDKLIPTFGVTLMLVGIGFITIGPLIGLIRDLSDSYAVSMYVLSGMAFTCTLLWLLMPAAVRYDQRREQKNST